jgi:hypothetical protein
VGEVGKRMYVLPAPSVPSKPFVETRKRRIPRTRISGISGKKGVKPVPDLLKGLPFLKKGIVETGLHPWSTAKPVICILAPLYVQSLFISCYVSNNKLVLSYLSLCLLPQNKRYPSLMATLIFCHVILIR